MCGIGALGGVVNGYDEVKVMGRYRAHQPARRAGVQAPPAQHNDGRKTPHAFGAASK